MSRSTRHRIVNRLEAQGFASKEVGFRENKAVRGPPAFGCHQYNLTLDGKREVNRLRRSFLPLLGIDL